MESKRLKIKKRLFGEMNEKPAQHKSSKREGICDLYTSASHSSQITSGRQQSEVLHST